jgi:sterol desaturase/sphingolipid hydroxylase (fatty acid hydroxylase superfamily)
VALLLGDLMYYQLHRLLHRVPWLWQFHAIHHSSPHVDWLATVRLHPLEVVLTKIVQMGPLYLLGFSQAALVTYTLVAAAFAFGIHARVPWRFPLLRWLVATPEFHHWHHAREPRRNQQNLAAQFPLWDWLGGTLYLPRGDRPQRYGIGLPVPEGYVAQVWFPFHRLGLGKGKRTH